MVRKTEVGMKIGIIGAGAVGGTLARLACAAGHHVFIANSRPPDTIAALAAKIGAVAVSIERAAAADDLVILAIPQHAVAELPATLFGAGPTTSIVIDAGNYFPVARDGPIAEIDDGLLDSEWVAKRIGRPVIKTFNMIEAHSLATLGRKADAEDRIALAMSGDGIDQKARVSAFIDQLGFDVVDAGPLSESWRHQPGTLAYCRDYDPLRLRAALKAVKRARVAQYREDCDDYVAEVVRMLGAAAGAP